MHPCAGCRPMRCSSCISSSITRRMYMDRHAAAAGSLASPRRVMDPRGQRLLARRSARRVEMFGSATIDPSGKRLVFFSSYASKQLSTRGSRTCRPAGSIPCRVAARSIRSIPPSLTDGRLIASDGLCRTREGNYEIYVMTVNARALHRIGSIDSGGRETPTWNSNATRLAYLRRTGPVEHSTDDIVVARIFSRGIAEDGRPRH